MAVLVEALNVVVRINRIRAKFQGGLKAFKENIPNKTLSMDSGLARVGFMTPFDAEIYIDYLEENGLIFISDDKAKDLIVIDQFKGPTIQCDWIELITVKLQGIECRACKLKSDPDTPLSFHVPVGWEPKEDNILFLEKEEVEKRMLYLDRNKNVEHYFDINTGKNMYVGRTNNPTENGKI